MSDTIGLICHLHAVRESENKIYTGNEQDTHMLYITYPQDKGR